ncbi:MAG: MBL fold metallo-hydrolase [Actinomycetota bacterium]|nr:MBL fold metallo-hydrolase [Actinomycetota bacterium]
MPSPWEQGFVEIADRCFVARYREWDVSIGVVIGTRGALVVDTRAGAAQGQRLRDDTSRLPGRPSVGWVVNTHEHFDHVFGNGAFSGAAIHAHENAATGVPTSAARIKRLIEADREHDPQHPEITDEILQDVLDTEPRLPDTTFSSAATIDLGDRYVELLHLGRGHTDGDLVLRVPDCDVVFAGDLIEESADRDATPGFGTDCWPLEWAPTLDLLIGLLTRDSLVVPGHGIVVNRDFVETQRDDIADVAEMVKGLASAGVTVDDALAAGERAPRSAPLSASVGSAPAPGTGGTGWPFPTHYLDEAVRRGYAHLGVPSLAGS